MRGRDFSFSTRILLPISKRTQVFETETRLFSVPLIVSFKGDSAEFEVETTALQFDMGKKN
jgi:hypothetical protein